MNTSYGVKIRYIIEIYVNILLNVNFNLLELPF